MNFGKVLFLPKLSIKIVFLEKASGAPTFANQAFLDSTPKAYFP
jgi:hypothetical protein